MWKYIYRSDKVVIYLFWGGFTMEYSEDNSKDLIQKYEKPVDLGTALMHYVTDNFPIEERIKVIRTILQTFSTDFFTWELPKGEVERLRDIIDKF